MIVYIAGPMTGLPEFNYPAFHQAAAELRVRGFRVLNPADTERDNPTPGIPQPWNWYMRRTLRMVIGSDAVCLLPGWQGSRGALLEVEVAEALGLDVRTLDEWKKAIA
jgi:hypothetical protein